MKRALVVLGLLLSIAVFAQNRELQSGGVVRAWSGGTDARDQFGTAVGQYTFNRCLIAVNAPVTGSFMDLQGLQGISSYNVAPLDGGTLGKWYRTLRQVNTLSNGSQPLNWTNGTMNTNGPSLIWRGNDAGLVGGWTMWMRWGWEQRGSMEQYFVGVGRHFDAACTSQFETGNVNGVVGVYFNCSTDGGPMQICSQNDAGRSCTVLGGAGDGGTLACDVAQRGFDVIMSHAGFGSNVFSYSIRELDSGVPVTGTITNDDQQIWRPMFRSCNPTANAVLVSLAGLCVGSNL